MKFLRLCGKSLEPYRVYITSKSKAIVMFNNDSKCGTQVCINFPLFSMDPKHVLTRHTYEHTMNVTCQNKNIMTAYPATLFTVIEEQESLTTDQFSQ